MELNRQMFMMNFASVYMGTGNEQKQKTRRTQPDAACRDFNIIDDGDCYSRSVSKKQ